MAFSPTAGPPASDPGARLILNHSFSYPHSFSYRRSAAVRGRRRSASPASMFHQLQATPLKATRSVAFSEPPQTSFCKDGRKCCCHQGYLFSVPCSAWDGGIRTYDHLCKMLRAAAREGRFSTKKLQGWLDRRKQAGYTPRTSTTDTRTPVSLVMARLCWSAGFAGDQPPPCSLGARGTNRWCVGLGRSTAKGLHGGVFEPKAVRQARPSGIHTPGPPLFRWAAVVLRDATARRLRGGPGGVNE